MKILHFTFANSRSNGIVSVLDELRIVQKRASIDVKIVNISSTDIGMDDMTTMNRWSLIKQFMLNYSPDIVIFHSIYLLRYIRISKFLNKQKIPYLIQLHGALSLNNYHKGLVKKQIANMVFFNRFIRNAKSIIYLNSKEYSDSIVAKINPNFEIIPNGCRYDGGIEITNKSTNILKITYLARIDVRHKGLDVLISALRKMKVDGNLQSFQLSIYGDGDEKDVEYIKTKISGISDFAKYYGAVYGQDKERVYQNTDIFILTSRYEGMPMGVLEALAHGIPCIVTPGTNMADAIENHNAGWKAELTDKSISQTIIQATSEFKKSRIYYKGNAIKLAKEYDWGNIGELSIKVYSKYI